MRTEGNPLIPLSPPKSLWAEGEKSCRNFRLQVSTPARFTTCPAGTGTTCSARRTVRPATWPSVWPSFPAGTLAAAHVHAAEEEIIYILSGAGAILAGEQEIRLEPGVAVFIPPGQMHRIRADEGEPLRLVTLFSPPVTPGAYDPGKK